MRRTLLLLNRYLGFALILLLQSTQVLAQQTASIKESVYASLVASPEPETLVDEVLEAWLDENGFDALRTHLDGRSTRPDLEVNEHAALGFLWRRIRQPVKALDHWKKATELKPGENALWIERAGQELRLNRFTDAVSSFEQITLPEDPSKARRLAHSLAFLISQTSDQSAKRILHDWMTSRPNDVVLWLELVDLHGRFSGSEKQWLERLADWRKTVKDPALLIKIRLLEFEELTNQGKPQEAFDVLIAALGETTADSKEEATLLPCVVNLLRQSVNAAPPLKPNLKAFAGTQMQRPAVLLALARELHERGELMQALDLIKALAESRPDDQRIQAAQLLILEENGRWDEALAQLRAGSDKIALALALKDAGQSAEALDALSQLPTSPLSIALRDLIAGKTPPIQEEPETPAFAPPEGTSPSNKFELGGDHSAEQLRDLFKRWQAVPKDPELTTALLNGWAATGKRAEADHLFRATLMKMESREERLTWVKAMQDLERGYSRYFDFPRALLSVDEDEQDKAEFWLLMAESLHGQMSDTSAWALTQAADHLSGEQALALRLQAAEMWFASNRFAKAILLATELLGSSQGAAAKLLLARIDFREGRIEQARRTMWALADHPAMTPTRALEMARELVQWQEAAEAAAFVALQRQRFPEDEALRTFQLERALNGNLTEPFIEMLLKMGSSQDPRRADSQGFGVEWARLQSAIAMIHAKELRGERTFEMTKRYRNELGINKAYFATAHLLRHAQRTGLDLTKRTELAERADAAGLPFPTSLIWARLHVNDHGQTTLIPELDQLERQPVEEWADAMALHYQQRLMEQPTTSAILTPQDHRILNTLLESLNVNDPGSALKLSFHWWRLHPEVSDSETALRTSLNLSEASTKQLPNQLHSLLMSLSPKQKTHPFMKEVSAVLLKWLETQDSKSESYSSSIFQVAACLFQLNQWQQAADLAERGWLLPGGPGLATIPQIETNGQPPSWVYWNSQSPLVWPPNLERSGLSGFSIFLTSQPPIHADSLIVPQEERTPFLAAGAKLTPYPLRLLWLLAGGDDEGAKTLIKDWQKETPDSVVATRLMAAVVASEGKLEEALELLHGMIAAHGAKSPEKRQHQVHYLRAALSPPAEFDPFSGGGLRPPPNQHRERVQQILRELQPELETWPPYTSNWLPVFKAAGIEEATAGWNQLNQVSHQTDEMSQWTILQASSNSRAQRQVEMAFTPHRISSYEVARLIQTGFRPQALVLLLRALKAEGDQTLLRPESSQGDWFQLLQQHPDLREDVLKAAGTLRRHRPRELNQAIHLAMACEAWQQVVDWGSEAQVIVDANPYLKSRVDLARLELGMRVDELAKELSSEPIHSQTERFRILMSSIHHPRSFKRLILLTELFVTLAEQSPPLPLLGGNEASSLANTALQALSRSYSLPNNAGVIPPLYPELEPNPSERTRQTPPETITEADLTKRRALHGRLCDLAFANPTWFPFSLPHLLQRHLIENQPTHEALVERLSQLRNDPTKSSHFNLDQLARTGHPWHDVSLRLRLAKLIIKLMAATADTSDTTIPVRQLREHSIENLIVLIGSEVQATAFPPLWALWEYPHDVDIEKRTHTAEQKAWNKERHAVFTELAAWALDQPAYLASIAPKWANYRLFFPDTNDEVLSQLIRLRDHPNDPFGLKAFLQSAQLAYDNEHHIRASEVAVSLLKQIPPEQRDPSIASQLFQLLSHGRSNQAEAMPPLEIPPETIVRAIHYLTADLQRRRLALVEDLGDGMELSALPTPLLLWRLTKAVKENADTKAIEDILIENGKAKPEQLNTSFKEYLDRLVQPSDITFTLRLQRSLLQIAEGYVDQAVASKQSPQWLETIARPIPPRWDSHIDAYPHPSGQLNDPDPYHQVPNTWADLSAEITQQRCENFLRALAVCARDPKLRLQTLSERLVNDLSNREKWPELFELLEEETKKGFYSESALAQWLQWEQSYSNLERVSAATDFLIQWSDRFDTLMPQSSHYWLRHAPTLYVRPPSKGLDPREYVSFAPADSRLHPSPPIGFVEMPEHRETAKRFQAEWWRLIEHATSKPAALPEIFSELTQAYLESDPQRLVSLAQQLPEEELTKALQPLLDRVQQSHLHIPLKFRLALAEFILLFPGVAEGSKPAPNQPVPPTIPLDVLSLSLNVSVSPYNSLSPSLLAQLQDPSLLSRRQALLDQIDQLAARDERLVAAQRVTQLLESLAQRPPTAAEIEQTLDHARAQPAGVLLAFDTVSEPNNVIPSQITEDQRLADLNQAELMISVIERWPGTLDYTTSHWFFKLMTLLGPYSNTKAEHFNRIASLQERLMDVASADQALTNRAFYAYADACCLTEEGTERLTRRIARLVQKSPIAANSALAVWLSNSHPVSTRPIDAELRGLTLCRDLLRDWPEPTTPETLLWPRSVLNWSQHGDLALRNSRIIGGQQQAISPTPPSNPASRALIGEILDLVQKRPAGAADWVVPARLRHNARLGLTPAALADVIEPLFQPELKDKTLAYFTQVFEIRSSPWPFFRHPALQGEVILEYMEELRDILRSLAAVAHGQWLPEADLDRLIAQIRSAESRFLTAVGTSLQPHLEVRGLAEEYKTLAAQRFRKSPLVLLLPADLPAYIQSSLIQEAALPEVVERVWQTLEHAPAMGSAALKTWAEAINKDTYYNAYRDAGKLVSRLLERWKADWPAPDWAVVFLRNWRLHGWKAPGIATSTLSAEDRAFGQLSAELRPQLQTQLMAFPSCSEEDYFALVVATPYGLPVPNEPKVIALAEAVVKNRLGSGRLPALLPEQAPVSTSYSASGKRSSPLSSPLWSPTETWVLLEHSLRNGRTPAIDALFDAEVWRSDDQSTPLFESLKGLFLDPAEAFVAHAANFRTAAATAKMKHDPFLWVLRIALLRELPLTWQDLRVMAPPSAAGTALGMLAVPQDSALQYWVHYLHERGEHSFVEDLVGYCRDIAAGSLFELASAAPVNVGPTIVHLRATPVPQKPFLSPEWNRVWESLITAAQVAATWPSVVTAAERLGFLENPKLADCFAAVRSNDSWTYQEPAAWLASLQPTGLSSDDAAIAPLWFSLDERPAWIWQLASLLDDDAKPAAMAELARLQRSQPALGRSLLRLALLASHSTLSPAQLTQELAPVLSQLNAQAEPLRIAIIRSLHAQSPRLSESIAAAPANALLRALSLAATEDAPATEVAFWLADAAAAEDSASADQVFLTNKLGDDLRRLVLSDHSQSSEVFLQGLDRLLQLASPTERTPETRSKLALDVLSRLVSNQPSGATSSQTPLPLKTTYRNRIRLVGFGTAHLPEEAVYLGLPGSQLESGLYLKFVCLNLPQQHQLDGRAIAHEMLYLANAQRPEGVLASFPHFRDLMLQLPPGETQQFLDTLREFAGQDQARLTLLWGFEQTLALLRGPTAEEIPWPTYLTERVQDPACPPLIRFWLAQAAPQQVAQIAPEALFTAAQDCLSSEKASTARLYLAKLDLRPIVNLSLSATAAQALDRFVTSFSQFVTQHSNDPTLRTTPEKAAVLDAQVFQPLLQKLTDPTHAPRRAALIESLAEAGLLPLRLVKQEWEAGTDPAHFHLRLPSKPGLSTQLPIINDLPSISADAVTRLQGLANSRSPLPLRSLQHLLLAGPDSPSEPPPPHLAHAQRLAGWKPSFAADPKLARDVLWHLSRSDWFTEAALPLLEELKALRDFHSDNQHLSYPSDRFVADLSLLCYQALLNWRDQRNASAWLRVLERRVMGSTRFAETHLPKYLAHILRTASPSEWAKEVPLLVEILQSRFSATLHPMVAHTFATVASGFSKDPAMEQLYDLLAKIDSPPVQLPQPDPSHELLLALANRTDLPLSLRLRALLPPKPFALTQPNPLDRLLVAQSAGLIDSADLAGQMDDFEVSAIVPHVYSLARWLQLTGQNEAAMRLITRVLAEVPASDLDDPLEWAYVAELCHHAQQPDLLQGALERAVPRDTGPQPALLYHLTARLKNP
jgi:hypothetical protein